MTLLSRPKQDPDGCHQNITPQNAQWSYVGFKAYGLKKKQTLRLHDLNDETCLVILSGKVDVVAGNEIYAGVGNRMNIFEDALPHAVYAPNDTELTITALTSVELAVACAPGKNRYPSRWIKPEQMDCETRGVGGNVRHICNILPDTKEADSLLVVEVKTPSGNWSSYPPHKHDKDNLPIESYLEETYYHRINPSQGFVFQRVFTDDLELDETMSVTDRCVVKVPRGYHPVGVPYGYDSYYLNVMAGPKRKWVFKNHPDHEWILKK